MMGAPAQAGRMGAALGAVAVVLAAIALVVSFAIPGPAGQTGATGADGADGATGPRGPTGPAGPGTLMNSTMSAPWFTGDLPIVGCTNIHSLDLTVPSAGTIVMTSTVHLWVDHTAGVTDSWSFHTTDSPTDCISPTTDRVHYTAEIPSSWPSDSLINQAGTVVNAFPVAAGTHTFYLNVDMWSGQSVDDRVSEASTVLVFYPS